MIARLTLATLLLAGCATRPAEPPLGPQPAAAPLAAHAGPPPLPASVGGIIRHYVRSNRDGSEPEHIVQFRPTRTDVAVYKWVRKCTTAAYVTAQLDPATMEPVGLDAGKVAKDGTQAKFGRIDLDPATRTVKVWADLPGAGRVADSAELPKAMPWFLFDYDLGDFNAWLQDRKPAADFMFAFALIWPDGNPDFFTHMATVHAAHRGLEARNGRTLRRFDLHFIAGKAGGGTLWADPDSGAIIEAEASVPNHPGMTDFRLKLDHVEGGGTTGWDTLLKAHHADCPA